MLIRMLISIAILNPLYLPSLLQHHSSALNIVAKLALFHFLEDAMLT